jgi:hypothetical protein
LNLFQLTTRKKYLRRFLRQTKPTLEALTLVCVFLDSEGNSITHVLIDEMTLEEMTLRYINVGDEGLRFDNISLQCPTCLDRAILDVGWGGESAYEENGWILLEQETHPEHELVLEEEEGEDISFWLMQVVWCSCWGEPWTCGYCVCRSGRIE